MKVGNLVKHNSYKNLLGIVVEINLNYVSTLVVVAWTGRNHYGFGNNSLHHPDSLEVIREGR